MNTGVAVAVIAALFAWVVSRHVRAARRSVGPARTFWRLLAALNASAAVLFAATLIDNVRQGLGDYDADEYRPSMLVGLISLSAMVVGATAFGLLALARTPLA